MKSEPTSKMKRVTRILIAVLALLAILVAIPFIIALFIRSDFAVEREIIINKPRQEVFDYVKHLKNQVHLSKWAMIDPNMKNEYRGKDGTVGFVSAWESELQEVGKGEQEIKRIVDGARIDVEIRMRQPFESIDPAYIVTESIADNRTKVKSGYIGEMNYPTNLLCPLVADKIGKDIETSLTNLKEVLEKQ